MISTPGREETSTPWRGNADEVARTLRERFRQSGLRPAKKLGQHFLADLNLAKKIAAALGPPGTPVLEIGAGLGAVTLPLVAAGHTGVAIEIDPTLVEWLGEALAPWPQFRIAHADIRTFDLGGVPFRGVDSRLRVVGNLPYYLTSEILLKLARNALALEKAVLMVQEDVAARLAALPGSRTYGSLTVAMALRFTIETVLRAPRSAFWPAPEVDSTVLCFTPIPDRRLKDPDWLEKVVRAGFAQRRKTLAKSLAAGLGRPRPAIEDVLSRLGIEPTWRAEKLAPNDFVRLADELASTPGEDVPA